MDEISFLLNRSNDSVSSPPHFAASFQLRIVLLLMKDAAYPIRGQSRKFMTYIEEATALVPQVDDLACVSF